MIRDLRHQESASPYRTQPEDRRGRFHIGVHYADVQGGEEAEGYRECGLGVMTVSRAKTATGSAANRRHVEFGRFLYDDGHSTSCEVENGKTQGFCQVGGYAAAPVHGASRIRQEGR